MSQTHVIGRIILELQLPEAAGAFYTQEKMGSVCRLDLPAALAPLFDQWSREEEVLCIDHLEIDLGSHSLEALQQTLPQLIKEFLAKHYPVLKQGKALPPGMYRIAAAQDHFETWLYFMEHGILPPYNNIVDRATWETAVLETLATQSQAPGRCRELFIANSISLERLTQQFDATFIIHWLEAYSGNNSRPALLLVQQLAQCCYYPDFLAQGIYLPARTVFMQWLYSWLIKSIVIREDVFDPVAWTEEILLHFIPANALPYFLHIMQMVNTAMADKENMLAVVLQQLAIRYTYFPKPVQDKPSEKAPDEIFPATRIKEDATEILPQKETDFADKNIIPDKMEDALLTPPLQKQEEPATVPPLTEKSLEGIDVVSLSQTDTALLEEASLTPGLAATVEATAQENIPVNYAIAEDNLLTEDVIIPSSYIGNAGLIILHPFIPALFEALGYIQNRAFCDSTARDKAVQLLGYLAGGQTALPEYELVLPKLLCGMLPTHVTDRFVELTSVEKAEADHLLATVITHWSVLKNTSPDGLRANFLLRQGKLDWEQQEWRLRVSQEAYDMLLNSLPWGISLCRFSWMRWVIKTDWI